MQLTPFDYQTAFLSKEEYNNPFLVFEQFFGESWPSRWRDEMWYIFTSAMSGSTWEHEQPSDRAIHMWRFQLMFKLFDASLRIHQLQSENDLVMFLMELNLEASKKAQADLASKLNSLKPDK